MAFKRPSVQFCPAPPDILKNPDHHIDDRGFLRGLSFHSPSAQLSSKLLHCMLRLGLLSNLAFLALKVFFDCAGRMM